MALVAVLSKKHNVLWNQSHKLLNSFFSSDGWSKLPSLQVANETGEPSPFYNHRYFLRELEKPVIQPMEGITTGKIPKWLEGSLLQNGPGKYTFGNSTAKHWFDGSAVIHKFTMKDGRATYESQLLDTETLRRNTKANKHVVNEFMTPAHPDPCHTIFQRFQAMFTPFVTDNTAVSIYPIDGGLFAITETPKMHKLNVEKVQSAGMVDLNKNIKIMSQSAHPHVTKDGSVYNVTLCKGEKGPAYGIYKIPYKSGKGLEEAEIVAKVKCSYPWNPSYMHSFGITDNYFIIIEQPLVLSVKSMMMSPILGKGFADVFRVKKAPVNFHVIRRDNGKKTIFTSDYFFFFHTINQYEDNGHLVIDVCTYDSANAINAFILDKMKSKDWGTISTKVFSGRPLRFVIPLESDSSSGNLVKLPNSSARAEKKQDGTVHLQPEMLCDEFCELPRFHYDQLLGQNYNFFYGICFTDKIDSTGKVIKVDTRSKKVVSEWYRPGTAPSEPIFVPSPHSKGKGSEDDGVLVVSVLSGDDANSVSLVVLDAKDLKEISCTEFKTPGPIPKSIHGWFA